MRFSIFIISCLILLLPCKLPAQYEVMFSNNYPPYNYFNENGELVGFNIDILNAIKDLYKTEIILSGDDWNTINRALDNGEINAIGGEHYPGTPNKDYIYTRSAIATSHCFLYNSNNKKKFSLEHLRSEKDPLIAIWKNDVLTHYVQSINPSTKFLFINNYQQLIKALDREDVTCIFGQRIGSMFFANKLNKEYVMPLEHRILERNMGFKVSKNSPELAELLNNGLEVILANGEYQRIYDKWITEYNKNPNDWHNYLKYLFISSILIAGLFLMLLVLNRVLKAKVQRKTKDLQQQLELNSHIMRELEKQKTKAEESDKMKSAFLANMSHEIRTPMNGILGFADLLKDADFSSKEQSRFIDIIQQSGHRMLGTINNIIDVSKLEAGMENLKINNVNIKNIMIELLNFFSPEASNRGIELTLIENSSENTKGFYTDEYKLNSILTNLIKNAIKFTKEGSIEVEYSIKNDLAEFWVKDTGIGIAQNKQDSVFGQFVQADFSHSSGFEGSGLGLSISQGYANLLNGEIQLKSEPGVGSTFYVRIPNNQLTEEDSKKELKTSSSSHDIKSKYNIIIVDDDITSFNYLKYALKEVTEHITHAKDGLEAIELAKKYTDTDIILMDIKMPKLNGFEATKEIRKFNKTVYIVAQTAYAQEGFKAKVNEVGCDAYIPKPIHKEKLLEVVGQAQIQRFKLA